jgi:hypothetical protein
MNDPLEQRLVKLSFPSPSPDLRVRVLKAVRRDLESKRPSRFDRWLSRAVAASLYSAVLSVGALCWVAYPDTPLTESLSGHGDPDRAAEALRLREEAIRTVQMEISHSRPPHAG